MSSISDEIQQLQLRLLELEKEKKEKEETDNKKNIEHNFKTINDIIVQKKTSITNRRYGKSVLSEISYDMQQVRHLEAIYNILQIIDDRLKKIEQN
jgi:hypothetical protein